MVFLFVILPCLLIITGGSVVLGLSIGLGTGLLLRSVVWGVVTGSLALIPAVLGGGYYFFHGFAVIPRPPGYVLYGRDVLSACFEFALILGGVGLGFVAVATAVRLTIIVRTTDYDEFAAADSPEGACFLCGKRLRYRELAGRVCKACQA